MIYDTFLRSAFDVFMMSFVVVFDRVYRSLAWGSAMEGVVRPVEASPADNPVALAGPDGQEVGFKNTTLEAPSIRDRHRDNYSSRRAAN